MAPTLTHRLRIATTTRSANCTEISRVPCECTRDSTENPTRKHIRLGIPCIARATFCRAPSAAVVTLRITRRCPRQPVLITSPGDVLEQAPDIGRALAQNNSLPLPGERSSWTVVRPDKVPDASAEVCGTLKCRLWLVPNGPAVLGPDWLPGLDGFVRDPFLSRLDGIDCKCLDHREYARRDTPGDTENGTQ